jgi:D-inositol-3-phosphate glycosyltransferase
LLKYQRLPPAQGGSRFSFCYFCRVKILLLSPAHPLRGGIAASSERLAQALQAEGHEVVIYSFALQYPAFLFPGKSQRTDPGEPGPVGLHIRTRLNSVNPLNWLIVGRELAREQPDRIIVRFWLPFMGPCLGTVLRVARFFSGKKMPHVTALVDNIVPHEKRPGDRPFAQWFVSACHDFVVMSRSVGEEIRQFLPASIEGSRIRFAPHPIYDIYGEPVAQSAARARLGLPPEAHRTVLFFGLIRPYKGLDLLLHALANPQLEGQRVHALIAGECYSDWAEYEAIIAQHGLSERVHLSVRFIPNDEVALYFSAADLVVQPYRTATQSGISQIAYHFEKPMVVTNVGGLPEIVAHGVSGYVVEPEPGALAAAIRDFFEQGRTASMTAGVRAEKQRFSWKNLTETLLAEA